MLVELALAWSSVIVGTLGWVMETASPETFLFVDRLLTALTAMGCDTGGLSTAVANYQVSEGDAAGGMGLITAFMRWVDAAAFPRHAGKVAKVLRLVYLSGTVSTQAWIFKMIGVLLRTSDETCTALLPHMNALVQVSTVK